MLDKLTPAERAQLEGLRTAPAVEALRARLQDDPEMLYTPDEAAKLLKVSRTTVYRLVARNALRSVRIGSSPNAMIRIPADELDFYFRTSVAGREVHERALKILELRGTHPTDATADEYVEALREAGGAEAVYADRVGIQIAVDMHALRAAEDDGADDGAEDE